MAKAVTKSVEICNGVSIKGSELAKAFCNDGGWGRSIEVYFDNRFGETPYYVVNAEDTVHIKVNGQFVEPSEVEIIITAAEENDEIEALLSE